MLFNKNFALATASLMAAAVCLLNSASAAVPTVLSSSDVTTLQQTTTAAPNASGTMVGVSASAPGAGARYRCDAVTRQCVTVTTTTGWTTYTETDCCESQRVCNVEPTAVQHSSPLTSPPLLHLHTHHDRDHMRAAPSSATVLSGLHLPAVPIATFVRVLLLEAVCARRLQQRESSRAVLA